MKSIRFIAALIFLITLTACRARVVKVSLINTSAEPVKTIIVDYPTATFGKDKLAPGETFSYGIKPLETGPLKVRFTGMDGREHSYTGPMLARNDEGEIDLKFAQNEVTANPRLVGK